MYEYIYVLNPKYYARQLVFLSNFLCKNKSGIDSQEDLPI